MTDSKANLEKSEEFNTPATVKEGKEAQSNDNVSLKRSRDEIGDKQATVNNTEDSEPEEKRPSFRLNPPTLIHGQAKSNPVQEASVPKRNFLRPSKLSAPASNTSSSAPVPSNGQPVASEVKGLGMLDATGSVSSSNPFLMSSTPDNEGQANEENVFGSNLKNKVKENGSSTFSKPADAASSSEANPFLHPGGEEKKSDEGGFVFGSNMGERVVKSEADSTSSAISSKPKVEDSPAATEFVFGKNLDKRAKVNNNDQNDSNTVPLTAPVNTFLPAEASASKANSDEVSSNSNNKPRKLEEEAAAMYAAVNERNVIPEVQVFTGEENEKNVLQVPCKLYHFCKTAAKYLERGQGYLRLNDQRSIGETDQTFQSRLVMRTHGSLRLVLNLKIWAHMLVEKASPKTVQIKTFSEGTTNVYLISATVNDAEQLYRAVEYRVLHLKQIEESNSNNKPPVEADSSNADSQASTVTTDSTTDTPTTTTEPTKTSDLKAESPSVDSTDKEPETIENETKV